MSVPFMLSIDYLNINAHPRLPPTRSARGSVTIFTLPQGFRLRPAGYAETGTPWASVLATPPFGGVRSIDSNPFSLPYHWEIIYLGISGERYPDLRSGRYRRFAPTISAFGRRYPAGGRTWTGRALARIGACGAPFCSLTSLPPRRWAGL